MLLDTFHFRNGEKLQLSKYVYKGKNQRSIQELESLVMRNVKEMFATQHSPSLPTLYRAANDR